MTSYDQSVPLGSAGSIQNDSFLEPIGKGFATTSDEFVPSTMALISKQKNLEYKDQVYGETTPSESEEKEGADDFVPVLSWYRWPLFFFYLWGQLLTSGVSQSFSPISELLSATYNVPILEANLCGMVFTVAAVPLSVVSVFMFSKMRASIVMKIGTFLFFVGGWLRTGVMLETMDSDNAFYWVICGQTLIAFSQPFYLTSITLVANKWFGDKERDLITSILSTSVPFGNVLALVQTGLKFRGMNDVTSVERTDAMDALNQMIFVQNIIISAVAVPFFFMIQDAPKHPPSRIALKDSDNKSLLPTMKRVFKNRNFVIVFLVFALMEGVFFCFGVTIDEILSPYSFTSSETALVGAITISIGVVSSTLVGAILSRFGCYKLCMLVSTIGTCVSLICTSFTFPTEKHWLILTNVYIMGFFLIPIIPISMNFANEVTFPEEATSVQGVLVTCGLLWGSCTQFGGTLIAKNSPMGCLLTCAACAGIAFLMAIFVKEDLRKTAFSKKKAEEEEQNSNQVE